MIGFLSKINVCMLLVLMNSASCGMDNQKKIKKIFALEREINIKKEELKFIQGVPGKSRSEKITLLEKTYTAIDHLSKKKDELFDEVATGAAKL